MRAPCLQQRVGACVKGIAPVRSGIHRPPCPVRLASLRAKAEIVMVYEEMADEVTHCPVRAGGREVGLCRRSRVHHRLGLAEDRREDVDGIGRHACLPEEM